MYDPSNVYRGRYKEFIEEILMSRSLESILLDNKFKDSEYHHVVPTCCGGKDDDIYNIRLYLTFREHFIAHKILAEDNTHIKGLVYAYWRMCNGKSKVSTPEEYALGKKLFRQAGAPNKGVIPSEETRNKISIAMKSRVLTEEHKEHIRRSLEGVSHTEDRKAKISGVNHPMYGKHHSEETKQKMRDSSHHRSSMEGKHHSEETKEKLRQAGLGRKHKEESKKKMSESQKGNKNNLGKRHSEETKQKMREAALRRYSKSRGDTVGD